MTTYGDWIDGPQIEVSGTASRSYFRFTSNIAALGVRTDGPYDDEKTDTLINDLRVTVDGGTAVANPAASYWFNAGTSSIGIEALNRVDGVPQAVNVDNVSASDFGSWFLPNFGEGYPAYRALIEAGQPGDASGYEEDDDFLFNSATLNWEMAYTDPGLPLSGIDVDIYTGPGPSDTSLPATSVLRENRILSVAGTFNVGQQVPQAPLDYTFTSSDLDPTNGGVHVYPVSRQATIPDWVTGGFGGLLARNLPVGMNASAAPEMTYLLTYPRYRYVYEEAPTTGLGPVVRLFPRDDGRGVHASPRIYPSSKARRIVGGFQ